MHMHTRFFSSTWASLYVQRISCVASVRLCVYKCGVGRTEQGSVLDSGFLPEKQYEINTSPSYTWESWMLLMLLLERSPLCVLGPAGLTLHMHIHTNPIAEELAVVQHSCPS